MSETDKTYREVEDLLVYQKLCDLHLEIWKRSFEWPKQDRFELTSQVLRSSNSSPAQLAEKNDDRHLRNKIEGVNRSRTEAGETIHHLFIAQRKKYFGKDTYLRYRERYKECIRMLNGLEKSLEKFLPSKDQRWVHEPQADYAAREPAGYPVSEHECVKRTTFS